MSLRSKPSLLHRFFERILEEYESAALVHREGAILDLKYETLADIGTLGSAAQTILKYFPLKPFELILLNDPYSGGTVLSTVSLMTAINEDLFLIVRTGFRPHLNMAKKIDEEGLRIPPTPLGTLQNLNTVILEAISEHPQAPADFDLRIHQISRKIQTTVEKTRDFLKHNPQFLTATAIKNYLDTTHTQVQKLLAEEAFGDVEIESELKSGEVLKLNLELSGKGLHLNFSGTTPSKRLCLTDSATFGACLGALSAFLQKPLPMNSGFFSVVQVESPLGSLLNAKFPSPTFLGMTEGVSLVARTVLKGLMKISHGKESADAASVPTMIHLKFHDKLCFFESVPGGTGASSHRHGADALQFWVRNNLETSVEEIERRFPLLVRQFGLRQGSGGKGQFHGGHGMTREYELLDNAELCWLKESLKEPWKGMKGAQDGEPAEIFTVSLKGEKTVLNDSYGQIQMQKGDRLFVSSGGGGGFGRV